MIFEVFKEFFLKRENHGSCTNVNNYVKQKTNPELVKADFCLKGLLQGRERGCCNGGKRPELSVSSITVKQEGWGWGCRISKGGVS